VRRIGQVLALIPLVLVACAPAATTPPTAAKPAQEAQVPAKPAQEAPPPAKPQAPRYHINTLEEDVELLLKPIAEVDLPVLLGEVKEGVYAETFYGKERAQPLYALFYGPLKLENPFARKEVEAKAEKLRSVPFFTFTKEIKREGNELYVRGKIFGRYPVVVRVALVERDAYRSAWQLVRTTQALGNLMGARRKEVEELAYFLENPPSLWVVYAPYRDQIAFPLLGLDLEEGKEIVVSYSRLLRTLNWYLNQ
jgi:hypothetical protein